MYSFKSEKGINSPFFLQLVKIVIALYIYSVLHLIMFNLNINTMMNLQEQIAELLERERTFKVDFLPQEQIHYGKIKNENRFDEDIVYTETLEYKDPFEDVDIKCLYHNNIYVGKIES